MNDLRLFVWENYGCDYTCGIAFALAKDAEQARQLILDKEDCADSDTLVKEPDVYEDITAFAVWGGG